MNDQRHRQSPPPGQLPPWRVSMKERALSRSSDKVADTLKKTVSFYIQPCAGKDTSSLDSFTQFRAQCTQK